MKGRKVVNRAMMRGERLNVACYRARVSSREYVTDTHVFNGCLGLCSEPYTPLDKCRRCGAYVLGDFVARVREVVGE